MESTEVSENPFSSPILEKKRFPIDYLLLSFGVLILALYISYTQYPEKFEFTGYDWGMAAWLAMLGLAAFCSHMVTLRGNVESLLSFSLTDLEAVQAQIQTLQPTKISRYLRDRGVTPTEEEIESLKKELTSGVQAADVARAIKILRELKVGRVSPFQIPKIKREIKRLGEGVVSLYREKQKRETRIIVEIEKMTRVIEEHMKQEVSRVEHAWGMPDHIHAARVEIENTAEKLRARYRQGNLSLEEMRAFYKEFTEKVIQPRQEIEEYIIREDGVVTMEKGQ